MASKRVRDGLILAAGLGLFLWATLPPDKVSLNEGCEPKGGPAAFSAFIYPTSFWRTQLEALVVERNDLLSQPARRARAQAEAEREMRENPALEERMMRLSREQERVDDKLERERREAALQSARLQRITWLMQCEAEVAARLAK
ncbi:hypothetical protein A6A04_04345 [Paramagnetospirillum marisnigri]|uniref:Uncharacterized protein n=1 Tax=Paramagnetospirillum marisnigri TaxID=1285242 RepID=A0A178MJ12_9PROT|nr:hypothetical protein [Paramagnetospirillum marisnigri]OAN47994.1 hypothetical protein A6A04_04345 [Paramagnetospirillum marisnigri]